MCVCVSLQSPQHLQMFLWATPTYTWLQREQLQSAFIPCPVTSHMTSQNKRVFVHMTDLQTSLSNRRAANGTSCLEERSWVGNYDNI